MVPEPAVQPEQVQVTFLGVGGLIVRWQGSAIMTAPLYSNPTLGEIALSEIHTDGQLVDALMREDVRDVRAILSGHAHYDHLMDAPYVALHRARHADLVGNDAMVKVLDSIKGDLGGRQLVSLQKAGTEYRTARFRVHAIESRHSPQIGPRMLGWRKVFLWMIPWPKVSLFRGEDEHPARELPVRIGTWTGGTTLAFVIELLDEHDQAAFRIYYQDSPTVAPYGYPDWPQRPRERYDLAVLCLGGSSEYRRFPGDIIRHLDPQYVMGIHWEDFLGPRPIPSPSPSLPPRPSPRPPVYVHECIHYAPGVKESRFVSGAQAALERGGRVLVPCPDHSTVFGFDQASGRWLIVSGGEPWTPPKE
jgi:hypothetical protein